MLGIAIIVTIIGGICVPWWKIRGMVNRFLDKMEEKDTERLRAWKEERDLFSGTEERKID